ncbi:surface antigen [Plasmodium falciparum UGT5.1]|uniref:Surface antigen n=1 Tax=Plasmodium falciparum UGT5.1 TaxID=1237627 RepID=W7JVI7_PLAFA|nr:surface antigen [Plasmodium falciparum UGT5.1]
MPGFGTIGGTALYALNQLKPAALAAAKELAEKAGAAKGTAAGIKEGIKVLLNRLNTDFGLPAIGDKALGSFFDAKNYYDASYITTAIFTKYKGSCMLSVPVHGGSPGSFRILVTDRAFCNTVETLYLVPGKGLDQGSLQGSIQKDVEKIVAYVKSVAQVAEEKATEDATATLTAQKTGVVQTTYMGYQTPIIASIVAILVIVLVMVIIYLILRYRRKKKMKKKLQYIKLLEE